MATRDVYRTLPDRRTRGRGTVSRLRFSRDGAVLATGHTTGAVVVWDARRGGEVRSLAGSPRTRVRGAPAADKRTQR